MNNAIKNKRRQVEDNKTMQQNKDQTCLPNLSGSELVHKNKVQIM